ncbi:uncharacterized protein LAESUDRAFT_156709 [Laetiporus sulphureus 93-53]|uniref:Uncharacterized protein n=1 Tax=Laetiporus sulphureus 93-53 TaxID=1314785 RepID=A0A165HLF4_9APHY|nr:uncharacterized protein LAESUDRAFT_156709 [Laetiporus sulphureus 93-53]KZT11884.1 hypothetical protein LAESUDRAFT_156709 [Laetiporus sulphureus 93-53]
MRQDPCKIQLRRRSVKRSPADEMKRPWLSLKSTIRRKPQSSNSRSYRQVNRFPWQTEFPTLALPCKTPSPLKRPGNVNLSNNCRLEFDELETMYRRVRRRLPRISRRMSQDHHALMRHSTTSMT